MPRAEDPEYWSRINQIISDNSIDVALVQPEHEVLEWARHIEAGNQLNCNVLLPPLRLAEALIDKATMTSLLDSTELTPDSIVFRPGQTKFSSLTSMLGCPFWIRSTTGSSGLGSLKVSCEAELLNWVAINPRVKSFIASRYLPGRNLACKLLYWRGNLTRAACGERVSYIMSKVAPSGITGNTSFGRLLNEPALIERAKVAMNTLFDVTCTIPHGFYTVDFKEDVHGKPLITEVNVRMVAFNLCFAMAGANFSEDIVRLLSSDDSFDQTCKTYNFPDGLVFLRDVDAEPILMNERDLLS